MYQIILHPTVKCHIQRVFRFLKYLDWVNRLGAKVKDGNRGFFLHCIKQSISSCTLTFPRKFVLKFSFDEESVKLKNFYTEQIPKHMDKTLKCIYKTHETVIYNA